MRRVMSLRHWRARWRAAGASTICPRRWQAGCLAEGCLKLALAGAVGGAVATILGPSRSAEAAVCDSRSCPGRACCGDAVCCPPGLICADAFTGTCGLCIGNDGLRGDVLQQHDRETCLTGACCSNGQCVRVDVLSAEHRVPECIHRKVRVPARRTDVRPVLLQGGRVVRRRRERLLLPEGKHTLRGGLLRVRRGLS